MVSKMPSRKSRILLTIAAFMKAPWECEGLSLNAFTSTRAVVRASRPLHIPSVLSIAHVGAETMKLMSTSENQVSGERDETRQPGVKEEKSSWNSSLRRLAELSLEDYEWRTSALKTKEADRLMEESVARIMGDEATYVRPMDANTKNIGPLGRAEKSAVDWLKDVIDEEGRRARQIVTLEGSLVRPKDSTSADGELGPLGFMEKQFVDFLNNIRNSERERARTKTLRPKDLDESTRGPLGEAELMAVTAIREVLDSEKLRAEQSRRSGEIVRPIDVPGPLGEFEMTVLEVVKAEQQRKKDGGDSPGAFVRPKDSSMKGPLGKLEQQAFEAVQSLTSEEKQRLRNIQKSLDENRPMEADKLSILGIIETIIVGIVRAPILLIQIIGRVSELLSSEYLDEADSRILKTQLDSEDKGSSESKK